jgi:hypothetical protein
MATRAEIYHDGRGFKAGNPGRPFGAKNKLTIQAREAFQLAFDKLGGWEGLAQWAAQDPDNLKIFYTLYARLIPTDLTTNGDTLPIVQIIRPTHGLPEPEAGPSVDVP